MANTIPILLPGRLRRGLDISGGVGTPNILYDSRRDAYWLLFTGWGDPTGLKREVFVAPIDEALNVDLAGLRKIIASSFGEAAEYTHNTARGIYNPAKDEFYVTTSHGSKIYLFTFNAQWEIEWYKVLYDYGRVKDAGLPFRPFGAYGRLHDALAAAPDLEARAVRLYLLRDVDDASKASLDDLGEFGRWGVGNDVLDVVVLPRIQIFVEQDVGGKWTLFTFMGPPFNDLGSHQGDLGAIASLGASLMPLLGLGDDLVQVGHPHYTTLPDGRPKLLLASFRDTWSTTIEGGREGYAHEIWAVQLGENVFDPKAYGELKGVFQGSESKWYYTAGASKLFVVSACEGSALLKAEWSDEPAEVQLAKGVNELRPLDWLKLRFHAACRSSLIARF